MRGVKRIRAALPSLTAEELRMVWKDVRRAADTAAIGGASSAQWMNYINVANDCMKELFKRFPEEANKDLDYTTIWTTEEYQRLHDLYRRIMGGKGGAQ